MKTIAPIVLETERLTLRPPREEDAAAIMAVASDERVAATTYLPHPFLRADFDAWLGSVLGAWREKGVGVFAVFTRHDGAFIGSMSLRPSDETATHASTGFWFSPQVWGQGYATEALQAVLRFGFEHLALESVEGRHFAFNPASGRVLEKAGLTGPVAADLPARGGGVTPGLIRTLHAGDARYPGPSR
ncbi:MAG: GCN5-related N-acetyltransferase [Akkermansiaceae bacterium]|nr:GCN5-related N-acetyltransferase [Akkermansiaceae bacterium]